MEQGEENNWKRHIYDSIYKQNLLPLGVRNPDITNKWEHWWVRSQSTLNPLSMASN